MTVDDVNRLVLRERSWFFWFDRSVMFAVCISLDRCATFDCYLGVSLERGENRKTTIHDTIVFSRVL